MNQGFPSHDRLMNATRMLYPQYWTTNVKSEAIEMNFPNYLQVLAIFFIDMGRWLE